MASVARAAIVEEGSLPLMEWLPCLDVDRRDRAITKCLEIAVALRSYLKACTGVSRPAGLGIGLTNGLAGPALLFAYIGRAGIDESYLAEANRILDAFSSELEMASVPTFLDGAFGVAWAWQHLSDVLESPINSDDPLLDEPLRRVVERFAVEHWRLDFAAGVAGLLAYAAARPGGASARERLPLMVDAFWRSRVVSKASLHWVTRPEWLHPAIREALPEGRVDLGMAHGQAGIIAALAGAIRCKPDLERTRTLLSGAVDFMSHRAVGSSDGIAAWCATQSEPTPARLGWCYGDLSGSIALGLAAGVGIDEASRPGAVMALRAASAPWDRAVNGVTGLCHGSSGLAHQFGRLYNATLNPRFRDAAIRWCERCLEDAESTSGLAGAFSAPEARSSTDQTDIGLLTGASGVGLALLSLAAPIAPEWDFCLQTHLAPRSLLTPPWQNVA